MTPAQRNALILQVRADYARVLAWTEDRYGPRALSGAGQLGGVYDRRAAWESTVLGTSICTGKIRRQGAIYRVES